MSGQTTAGNVVNRQAPMVLALELRIQCPDQQGCWQELPAQAGEIALAPEAVGRQRHALAGFDADDQRRGGS
ncbi:MAG: hypothetical protein KC442_15705 [Thermomicrobiales bacterium]|nr:hypothetical protein [Thermomicrobiales bacterium]